MTSLAYLSISDASALIKSKRLSPVEYAKDLIERIDVIDPHLHAFVSVAREKALEWAQASAEEIFHNTWRGPLHGIPYALKDIIDYGGMPTTAHSKILAENVACEDATVTRRLNAAGGICLGKLSTHEFAIGGPSFDLPWAPARNPWNLAHHPGGSSSGCGAAVAAGLVPAAIGTDTGGSIRNPASMCGIVGLKPTYGRVSRKGVVPLSFSLDHVGPMTRSVEDNALLFGVIAGHDSGDPSSSTANGQPDQLRAGVKGLRIGYIRHFHENDMEGGDSDMISALDSAASQFAELGAHVRAVTVSPLSDYAATHRIIMLAEAYSIHEEWLKTRPGDYGASARRRLLPGAFFSGADYVSALRVRATLVRQFAETMSDLDLVMCVSSMEPAAEIEDELEVTRNYSRQARMAFDLLGNPAISVPTGFSRHGMPLAMQIVGKPFAEATVYRGAYAYEQAIGWGTQHPAFDNLPR